MPRLFVARFLPRANLSAPEELADVDMWEHLRPPSPSELLQRAATADVLLTTITERLDADLIDHLPTLRGISNMAVGCDNIDLAVCRRRGIQVTNTPGVLSQSVAEMTFALILAVSRRLSEAVAAVRNGEWGAWEPYWMCGRDLHGSTLGEIGVGGIGSAVAELAKAFGMHFLGFSRAGDASLLDVLENSDVVTIHLPLTAQTRHLISREELRRMKRGAILINTSRGDVVDEVALFDALAEGHLAGAGLDVVSQEPMRSDHPLLTLENVIVTPHIGSATITTRDAMVELAVANACDLLGGRAPRHVVAP
jgi:glyoxylate reductase